MQFGKQIEVSVAASWQFRFRVKGVVSVEALRALAKDELRASALTIG
jgi:hypothetical protein